MTSSRLGLLVLAAGAVAGALAAWGLLAHRGTTARGPGERSGRIEFTVTGEPGVDLDRLKVAVFDRGHRRSDVGSGGDGLYLRASGTEGVHLEGGRGTLELPEGHYDLWVGAMMSPESRGPRVVPDIVSVTVRADRPVLVKSSLRIGGVATIPPGLGLPPASYGRLRVRCSQGAMALDRWIALRPSERSNDMVWPPLPVGEWDMVVELKDGSTARLHARIDRNSAGDAGLAR